jgi:hypothetical protein
MFRIALIFLLSSVLGGLVVDGIEHVGTVEGHPVDSAGPDLSDAL